MTVMTHDVLVARVAEMNARTLAMQLRRLAEDSPAEQKRIYRMLALKADDIVSGIQEAVDA
jgi:hypothetical protein